MGQEIKRILGLFVIFQNKDFFLIEMENTRIDIIRGMNQCERLKKTISDVSSVVSWQLTSFIRNICNENRKYCVKYLWNELIK